MKWWWLGLLAALSAGAADKVTSRTDAVGQQLNEWFAQGTAAGLAGLQYENRDGGHALLADVFPGLKRYSADEAERKAGRHMGPAHAVRPEPTLGNCSMAAAAEAGGSLPRMYLLSGTPGFRFIDVSYLKNNRIIYPEHQDHDVGANGVDGWGDLFPANHPGLLITQGSSLSDLPFVQAWFSTVAAFTPEVQKALINSGLLMPTVNMIFRKANKQVQNAEDYFTSKAHPVVFDGNQLDESKMIHLAHEMTPLNIPPVAVMEMLWERGSQPGMDFFEREGVTEKLGDGQTCLARVFRSTNELYEAKLSARRSVEVQAKPLTMKWVVLQGRKECVELEPSKDGAEATLKVRWHDDMVSSAGTGISTRRVDVALFASSPVADSPPAIFSLYMLPNEKRFFNKQGRLTEVCYQAINEHDGIPRMEDDPRWLEWLSIVAGEPVSGERWVRPLVMPYIQKAASEALASVRGVRNKDNSDKWKAELARVVKETRTAADGSSFSFRSLARDVVNTFANDPQWFVNQQTALLDEVSATKDQEVMGEIAAGMTSYMGWGVLLKSGDDVYTLAGGKAAEDSASVAYYMRGLNLLLLSKVILPRFLNRGGALNICDGRLSSRKPWRDVMRYSEDGTRLGWMRHMEGRVYGFTTDGRMKRSLADGDESAVPVSYQINNGTLTFTERIGSAR
jgi:hypothetical protein